MDALVQPLPASRVRDAVAVLTNAFVEDPVFNYFFPDPADRARVFVSFFNDLILANLRFGHVYCALDGTKMIGAAVWHPPDAGEPTLEDQLRFERTELRISRISKSAVADLFAGFARLGRSHPDLPHWYLMFIGVDRESRAKHVGSSLMGPVLSLADQHGELCYLETPFQETLPFYRNHGFEITEMCHPFRGAPTIWTMSREPQLD